MVSHRSPLVALCVLLLAAISGCKPKAGAACQTNQYACTDAKTGLFCGADGKFASMTCSGGCSLDGNTVKCDNSVAAPSDGCAVVGDVACTADHKGALECGKDFKFAVAETCKGLHACTVAGDTITCDNDTSDEGDPCRLPGDYACTPDKLMALRCDDHKMAPLNSCRGPHGCRIVELPQEKKVDVVCDDSVANEGDPCDTNGEEACAFDKKGMFVCKANKFSERKACPGPAGCTYEEHGDRYACDTRAAAAPAAGARGGQASGPTGSPAAAHSAGKGK